MTQIKVENLSKIYRVAARDPGLSGAIRGLFRRRHKADTGRKVGRVMPIVRRKRGNILCEPGDGCPSRGSAPAAFLRLGLSAPDSV